MLATPCASVQTSVSCCGQDLKEENKVLERKAEGSKKEAAASNESRAKLEQQHRDDVALIELRQVKADALQKDLLGKLERKQQEHAADLDKVLKAKERLADEVSLRVTMQCLQCRGLPHTQKSMQLHAMQSPPCQNLQVNSCWRTLCYVLFSLQCVASSN